MNRFKTAIDIQNAINPVAVAGVFHDMTVEALHENRGMDHIKKDPAVRLVLYKLMDMFQAEGADFSEDYRLCRERAVEEESDA